MGNFSQDPTARSLDASAKQYVGVRIQQAVPLVDADWNLLDDIRRAELEAFGRLFIGSGVPAGSDGFHITAVAAPNDFAIGGGLCLVEGKSARNDASPGNTYTTQPNFGNPRLDTPLPPLTTPPGNKTFLAVLDVWEREVNSNEDPGAHRQPDRGRDGGAAEAGVGGPGPAGAGGSADPRCASRRACVSAAGALQPPGRQRQHYGSDDRRPARHAAHRAAEDRRARRGRQPGRRQPALRADAGEHAHEHPGVRQVHHDAVQRDVRAAGQRRGARPAGRHARRAHGRGRAGAARFADDGQPRRAELSETAVRRRSRTS